MTETTSVSKIIYLWQIPYDTRRRLCDLLDADKSWRELGGCHIGMTETELELLSHAILRRESPTNALMTKWEQANPTITQLYVYLCRMNHKRAMLLLRTWVEPSLQALCDAPDSSIELQMLQELLFQSKATSGQSHLPSASCPPPNSPSSAASSNIVNLLQAQQRNRSPISLSSPHQALDHLTYSEQQEHDRKRDNRSPDTQHTEVYSAAASTINAYDDDLPYSELLVATNNFCKSNIIGSGGFGVVYKGFWKGTKVAIKRLKDCGNAEQAITELKVLNQYRIDNIVPLYGICLDGPEPCLIYQYMINGSLDNRLQCKNNSKPLSWMQRAVIGEGVAKALNYLHTRKGKPLIHGDVKSANILLDAQMQPKLGDFGLAKFLHSHSTKGQYTHMTVTSVHGTVAYLPPEYLRNKILSPAVDVYSYGVVMYEMATGRRAFDGKDLLADTIAEELDDANQCKCASNRSSVRSEKRSDLLQLIEPHCECQLTRKSIFKDRRLNTDTAFGYWFDILLNLGLVCCNRSKRKRPTFAKILELYDEMERLRTCSQFFPTSTLRHPSSSNAQQLDTEPIKTPFELHLWQQIVQRETNTLPTSPSSCSQVMSRPTEIVDMSNTKEQMQGTALLPDNHPPLHQPQTQSKQQKQLLQQVQSSQQHHQQKTPTLFQSMFPLNLTLNIPEETQTTESDSTNCIIPLITELGINQD